MKQAATKGLVWSSLERVGRQGAQFLIQIVLARILLPEVFGLVAMVLVFINICYAIVDAGFSYALVQRKEIDEADCSTVFYLNIIIGLLTAAVLTLVSPLVAMIYGEPDLIPVLQMLSVGLFFRSLSCVQEALLKRDLKFKKMFYASLPCIPISGLVGIVMAYEGYGVYALVAQTLLYQLTYALFLWSASPWRPRLIFSKASLQKLFPFGSKLLAAGLINTIFENLYTIVIGILFPPASVAFYQRARSFERLPVSNIQVVLQRVFFPIMSKMQDDIAYMKATMKRIITLVSYASFGLLTTMAVLAEPLILVLIGENWLPVVPLLQLLCVVGALFPIQHMNFNAIIALGRSDISLRLEIIKKLLVVAIMLVTMWISVKAMVIGTIIASLLGLMLNTHYTNRLIGYSLDEQMRDSFIALLMSAVVIGVVLTLFHLTNLDPLADLLLGAVLAAVIGFLGLKFLPSKAREDICYISDSIIRVPILTKWLS